MPKDERPTVYSTERGGDLRKKGGGKRRRPNLPQSLSLPPEKQTIYLRRESKGRRGKVVSLVQGLELNEKDLKALAKKLKRTVGSGGTIKDGMIEIQGEHRTRIAEVLEKMGYGVKIAGG
jgi:translation initiation factor 1